MGRIGLTICAWILLAAGARGDGYGTAFAISEDGLLVTCEHVIDNATSITIVNDGKRLEARVLASDKANDLAVLKAEGWKGKALALSSSAEVRIGSEVFTVGYPDPEVLGANPKLTKGIVNSLTGFRDDPRNYQISVNLNPGNSGGPLLSSDGRVVGVASGGINWLNRMIHGGYAPQNVNYAIKVDYLLGLLSSLPSKHRVVPGAATPNEQKQSAADALPSVAMVIVEGKEEPNEAASAGTQEPWVFPKSHERLLDPAEVARLSTLDLWRARNEMFVRRGYIFDSEKGKQFAALFPETYVPRQKTSEAVYEAMNRFETANLELIQRVETKSR